MHLKPNATTTTHITTTTILNLILLSNDNVNGDITTKDDNRSVFKNKQKRMMPKIITK